jgi:hypothetical protein
VKVKRTDLSFQDDCHGLGPLFEACILRTIFCWEEEILNHLTRDRETSMCPLLFHFPPDRASTSYIQNIMIKVVTYSRISKGVIESDIEQQKTNHPYHLRPSTVNCSEKLNLSFKDVVYLSILQVK